jgi:UDP-2-acetamido-3-amino-2,3-dideoxy-glucuronate N-acetyltransferase
VVIGPDVTIGNGCKIQNNVSVYKGVTLEDGVFCGPSMVFTNVHNPRAHIGRMDEIRATVVKKGASLGANCTVICGNDIGRFAFVGAGAVVTKDVPDYALVMGMPARIVGWVCECGEQLSFAKNKAKCAACGNGYRQAEEDRIESETQ